MQLDLTQHFVGCNWFCYIQSPPISPFMSMSGPNHNSHAAYSAPRNGRSLWQEDEVPEASVADSTYLRMRSRSPETENGRLPLPVWMRESSESFHWKWVPLPIRNFIRSVITWTKGPDPPQLQMITPFLPAVQEAPLRLVDRFLPKQKHKTGLVVLFCFSWVLTFSMILRSSASSGKIEGYGKPQTLWCGASYW